MTSATLFREGTDLDALLAELDEQYDGQIRVVEINHTREGGVLGFFARPRVAVHFTIGDADAPGDNPPPFPAACPPEAARAVTLSEEAAEFADPLDALIAAAEMVETGQVAGRSSAANGAATESAPAQLDGVDNVEFARMLLDIAARKAAERGVDLTVTPEPAITPATATVPSAPVVPVAAPAIFVPAPVIEPAVEMVVERVIEPVIEPIEFEQLTPTVEVTKPKAVRVTKPKSVTAKATKTTKAAGAAKSVKTATTATTASPVSAASPAKAAKGPKATAAKPRAKGATKTETAAAVEAKIAAVGESLRAELSIADLHESDERLTLRRRLSELGVPFDRIPTDAPHRYAAVEQLVHALPGVAPLPESDGQIVVIAGPSAQVAATAELLIKRMSLLPWQVWAYRCPGIAALPDREIRDAGHAAAVAAHARQGSADQKTQSPQNTLVVIGLDEFETEQLRGGTTAAAIVRALGPDAFWLHVDATRKASDTAALVRELGTPTALVVTGAARTASPASVWELNLPVALLDGRPATPSAWAVLLLDKLVDAAA